MSRLAPASTMAIMALGFAAAACTTPSAPPAAYVAPVLDRTWRLAWTRTPLAHHRDGYTGWDSERLDPMTAALGPTTGPTGFLAFTAVAKGGEAPTTVTLLGYAREDGPPRDLAFRPLGAADFASLHEAPAEGYTENAAALLQLPDLHAGDLVAVRAGRPQEPTRYMKIAIDAWDQDGLTVRVAWQPDGTRRLVWAGPSPWPTGRST